MSNQHSDRVARAARRKTVASLYLKGWTQTAIAERLGTSQGTISKDLRALQKEWRRSARRAIAARHALEIRKLDALEEVLWQAWEESQKPLHKAETCKDITTGKETHRTSAACQNGDPRFLALVQKCLVLRGTLLQPRGPQESSTDVESELCVRRDRILAVAFALRERERLATDRPRVDPGEPGGLRALVESDHLPPPAAPPPA